MTTAELIAFLQKLPPDTPVVNGGSAGSCIHWPVEIGTAKMKVGVGQCVCFYGDETDRNDTEVVVIR